MNGVRLLEQVMRASVLLALVATATACSASGASGREGRYVDPVGWSLSYPRAMHLERSHASMRIDVSEVTVASFAMRRAVHSGSTANGGWLRVDPPHDRHGRFPADGVAFRILRREGGPGPDVELPESRFPLRLASFGRAERMVVANGRDYVAQAWIGARASAARRSQLARVVSSLAFPRLRVGETVGYGFSVLPPASRYPVGSVTRVRVQRQPFYLVHAPGGFYAVGWRWQSILGGYKSHCDMRLDRPRKQFFCTNMGARWDRVGRVLAKPRGAAAEDPLNVTVAKVAWDGHVLLTPGVARFADARYAHLLWPGTYARR
jgi:hypothetical protein